MKDDDIESICEEFQYDLMEKTIKASSAYKDDVTGLFVASKLPGFIQFGYTGEEKDPNDTLATRGWKLHISINDENKINLKSGWNLLLPIFVKYKLIGKVVNSDEDFHKKN